MPSRARDAGGGAARTGALAVTGRLLTLTAGACGAVGRSPGLDDKGNSIAGIAALDAFTTLTGW